MHDCYLEATVGERWYTRTGGSHVNHLTVGGSKCWCPPFGFLVWQIHGEFKFRIISISTHHKLPTASCMKVYARRCVSFTCRMSGIECLQTVVTHFGEWNNGVLPHSWCIEFSRNHSKMHITENGVMNLAWSCLSCSRLRHRNGCQGCGKASVVTIF